MLELFPEGFEEVEGKGGVELAAYTNAGGEERLWQAFGGAVAADVEAGWEDRWRAFHRPVCVGELWIGPPWEETPAGAACVVIDPGQAFGTGSHATTRLCVELLMDLPRGRLLDVGCGSGVLSIAAARLGFGPVLALDSDPLAVEATATNARANGVDIEVELADAFARPLPHAEVTVANIALDAVVALGPLLDCDHVVTSGYLLSEEPELAGFARVARRAAQGWAADVHERR